MSKKWLKTGLGIVVKREVTIIKGVPGPGIFYMINISHRVLVSLA